MMINNDKSHLQVTPPNSPSQAAQQASATAGSAGGVVITTGGHSRPSDKELTGPGKGEREFEPMELQIDFWTVVSNKEANKCTLKGTFRHLQVIPTCSVLSESIQRLLRYDSIRHALLLVVESVFVCIRRTI